MHANKTLALVAEKPNKKNKKIFTELFFFGLQKETETIIFRLYKSTK